MGSSFDTWNGVEGAYYTGAGSGEMLWLIISIILCVLALIFGAKHELGAYKKAQNK